MVFKRYIKRGGKQYGPYYYESYRDSSGKVHKRYLGTKPSSPLVHSSPSKNTPQSKSRRFVFLLLLAGFFVLFLCLFFFFASPQFETIMRGVTPTNSMYSFVTGVSGYAVSTLAEESVNEHFDREIDLAIKEAPSVIGTTVTQNKNDRMDFNINGGLRLYFDLISYEDFLTGVAEHSAGSVVLENKEEVEIFERNNEEGIAKSIELSEPEVIVKEEHENPVEETALTTDSKIPETDLFIPQEVETSPEQSDASLSITGNIVRFFSLVGRVVGIDIVEPTEVPSDSSLTAGVESVFSTAKENMTPLEISPKIVDSEGIKTIVDTLAEDTLTTKEQQAVLLLNNDEFAIVVNTSESRDYKWGYRVALKDLKFFAKISVTSNQSITQTEEGLLIGRNLLSFDDLVQQGYNISFAKPALSINASIAVLRSNVSEVIVNETFVSERALPETPTASSQNNSESLKGNQTFIEGEVIPNVSIELSNTTISETENEKEISPTINKTLSSEKTATDSSQNVTEFNMEQGEEPLNQTTEASLPEIREDEKQIAKETQEEKKEIEKEEKQVEKHEEVTQEGEKVYEQKIEDNQIPEEPGEELSSQSEGVSLTGNIIRFMSIVGRVIGVDSQNLEIEDTHYSNTVNVYLERDFSATGTNELIIGEDYEDVDGDGALSVGDFLILDPTLIIIPATVAEHLDESRTFVKDIYDLVKEQDNNYTYVINNSNYVRVRFLENLTNVNDITLFARGTKNSSNTISVYKENESEELARFENVSVSDWYRIFLTNLSDDESVHGFDLQINGSGVEFDYIVDPTYTITTLPTNDSTNVNITQETNFSHLTIDATISPYNRLTGYWSFDHNFSTVSNITYDYSIGGRDGIANGGVVYYSNASCLFGACAHFDQKNDEINISESLFLGLINESNGTMMAWVKPAAASPSKIVFTNGEYIIGDTLQKLAIVKTTVSGVDNIYVYNEDGAADSITMTYNVNEWIHVVWMHDANNLTAWKNGALVGSITSGKTQVSSSDKLFLGNGSAIGLNGSLDEVMVFNTSLTATQIQDIYNNQSARFKSYGTQTFNVTNTTAHNQLNVTTNNSQAFISSNLSVFITFYNGSWQTTTNQTVTSSVLNFNTPAATIWNVSYEFFPGNKTRISSTAPFYSPLLEAGMTFEYYGLIPPGIDFTSDSPANNTRTTNTSVILNVSIVTRDLDEVKWNWNTTNYTLMNNSLVLFMNLDNRSALGENDTHVADVSGNSNNGTSIGGARVNSSADCRYNNCFTFDGVNDYVNITLGHTIGDNSTSFWYKNSSASSWTHVARNRTNFFVNGVSATLIQYPLNISGTNIHIGVNGSVFFNGSVDEVMVFNRTLSDSEIYQLYASNLYKFNSTQWYLTVNQSQNSTTGLSVGNYTYRATAKDIFGNENITQLRSIEIFTGSGNIAPRNMTAISINSTTGTNLTRINLTCFTTLEDTDLNKMNVSVRWYRNNTAVVNLNETGNYANGTAFSTILDNANTTKLDTWNCEFRIFDGTAYNNWQNSTGNVTIANSPPGAVLSGPANGNTTTDRTPNFSWSGNDDDGDSIQYEINLTAYYTGGGRRKVCDIYKNTAVIGGNTSYTIANADYLKCLFDNGYFFNWTVRAYDGVDFGGWNLSERNISINSDLSVTLPTNFIEFGRLNISDIENTSDGSPAPFVIRNTGNVDQNISINFTQLWTKATPPDSSMRYRVRNLTAGCFFVDGNTTTPWTNAPSLSTHSIYRLNFTAGYQTLCDNATVDIHLQVPADEPSGNKTSRLTFISRLGEPGFGAD